MKCQNCDGTGLEEITSEDEDDYGLSYSTGCLECNGTGLIKAKKDRNVETIIEELENCFYGYDEDILELLAELKGEINKEVEEEWTQKKN